jgi:putative toxin-antitoxin system antitoxin component (TIGR02293 family)
MSELAIFEPEVAHNATDDVFIIKIIQLVRKGISFNDFKEFAAKTPFSLSDWSSFLHVSERTIQRYQKESKRFDTLQSEKIVEIALLQKRGVEVFGKKLKFDSWLETSNLALGDIKPKSFLDSNFGINLVKDELARIEHGVLV